MYTYSILKTEDAEGVEAMKYLVNEALEAGWELQGGLSIAVSGKKMVYVQAIVKKKERQSFLN